MGFPAAPLRRRRVSRDDHSIEKQLRRLPAAPFIPGGPARQVVTDFPQKLLPANGIENILEISSKDELASSLPAALAPSAYSLRTDLCAHRCSNPYLPWPQVGRCLPFVCAAETLGYKAPKHFSNGNWTNPPLGFCTESAKPLKKRPPSAGLQFLEHPHVQASCKAT